MSLKHCWLHPPLTWTLRPPPLSENSIPRPSTLPDPPDVFSGKDGRPLAQGPCLCLYTGWGHLFRGIWVTGTRRVRKNSLYRERRPPQRKGGWRATWTRDSGNGKPWYAYDGNGRFGRETSDDSQLDKNEDIAESSGMADRRNWIAGYSGGEQRLDNGCEKRQESLHVAA